MNDVIALIMEHKNLLVPMATGIGGFAAGIFTYWFKSIMREREKRSEYRRELIKKWRDAINDYEVWRNGFGDTPEYASLRLHMRQKIIGKFEAPRTFYVPGGRGEDARKHFLLDEIARIEKKWGLI